MLFMFVFHYHFIVDTLANIWGASDTAIARASASFFVGVDGGLSASEVFLKLAFLFPLMSGITSTFHKDTDMVKPFAKAGKFLVVAAVISIFTKIVGGVIDEPDLFIKFGIIHMIALATLLYALVNLFTQLVSGKVLGWIHKVLGQGKGNCQASHQVNQQPNYQVSQQPNGVQGGIVGQDNVRNGVRALGKERQVRWLQAGVLGVMGGLIVVLGLVYGFPITNSEYTNEFAWLGFVNPSYMSGDYYPMIPFAGYLLLGAAIGKLFYAKRQSLLPRLDNFIVLRPYSVIGRYALPFYIGHIIFLFVFWFLYFWITT